MSDAINIADENASVIAYTHSALPGFKVQASPDCPTDPKSQWSALVTADGATLMFFAGKSFANQKRADKAIRKYLSERAARG